MRGSEATKPSKNAFPNRSRVTAWKTMIRCIKLALEWVSKVVFWAFFEVITSRDAGTTRGRHQFPRFLYFILDNNWDVRWRRLQRHQISDYYTAVGIKSSPMFNSQLLLFTAVNNTHVTYPFFTTAVHDIYLSRLWQCNPFACCIVDPALLISRYS